jgi:D-serine deaminase-like pyridoxal phosphate-dependent protein
MPDKNPTSMTAAKSMNREAADLLVEVAAGKHRAAVSNPEQDKSAANAARAKREGWDHTSGPSHTPSQ